MLKSVSQALTLLRDGLSRAEKGETSKQVYWGMVRANLGAINSIIVKTAEMHYAERDFRRAAERHTGGFDINASFFLDKEEERSALEATRTTLARYRESLSNARLSETARILRRDTGEEEQATPQRQRPTRPSQAGC